MYVPAFPPPFPAIIDGRKDAGYRHAGPERRYYLPGVHAHRLTRRHVGCDTFEGNGEFREILDFVHRPEQLRKLQPELLTFDHPGRKTKPMIYPGQLDIVFAI